MRYIALMAGLVWMTGCSTGATGATRPPLGGRMTFEAMRYRPSTPEAMPRGIPSELEEASEAPEPAVARAPAPTSGVKKETPVAKAPPRVQRPTQKKRPQPAARPVVARDARETVLAAARALVGKKQLKVGSRAFPSDCTGLVEAAHSAAGISLRGTSKPGDNGVTALYRYALDHGRVYNGGRPLPGDLVFFRETYDQNRDGRRNNDGLTHVGIVDQVDADGTVTVIHRVSRGVARYRMNLAQPRVAKDPRTGKVLNDTLRASGPGRSFALTGQLFVAYATVLPGAKAPVAVARR